MVKESHWTKIRKILIAVLALNWLVSFLKLVVGYMIKSQSMVADGYHSFSDGASNIIGIIGIHFACQPTDKDHPYGHKKYETLFSLVIAVLLFILAFNLAKEGIERMFRPVTPSVTLANFIVMFVTLAINFWVMRYEHKKGQSLRSDILISDAMHTKADIFTSLSVIITLVLIKLGYPILDPIATIIISLFIAHAAFDITRQSSRILCDTVAIMDTQRITDIVLGIRGVRTCHKIRTRGRPDDIYVDLHVQVNPDMHVDKAHKISYTIEEEIKKGIPEITDVVVHIEPEEKG